MVDIPDIPFLSLVTFFVDFIFLFLVLLSFCSRAYSYDIRVFYT